MMSKFRVMIVDDEEDVRTILRLALSPKYEVVEANDGLDVLDKLERAEPDFLVLDVMMPLMDGFETCRAIRKNPRFHDIPVLFLSAQRTTEAIKQGYGAGANLYLTKPFEPDRLVKNVDYALEQSRAKPRPKRYPLEQVVGMGPKATAPAQAVVRPAEAPEPPRPETPEPPLDKASEPAPSETPPPPPPRAPAPLRPRVMVVDDDTDLLNILSIALGADFEVTTARNGIEAVERIVLYEPDLIVLDAMLPKMSGYQLCTSLRQNQNYCQTPIVFVSAKSSQRDQDYCRRLGANDFVAKPFDPEALRERLLAFTALPGFAVNPKKLTLAETRQHARGAVEWADEAERHARRRAPDLQDFIDREMRP